ncbi:MAG: porin family protein, partial [Hymenobacteraceae bacterium]|nr:porin family protein [Hymenobacteraceae bacterium]
MQTLYRVALAALLLLLAFNVPSKAQDQHSRGYIGVGLGPSFIPGNNQVKTGTGLHLNLLNVGYVIGKGFGVTGTWVGGAHAFDAEVTAYNQGTTSTLPAQVELSYGVLMIGPMYTLNLADDASLDFKLRFGSLYTYEKTTSETVSFTSENRTLGASLGVGYRKKIANRWCIMLSSD